MGHKALTEALVIFDPALEAAHVAGDHVTDIAQPHLVAECAECTCEIFEPVTFEIRRAS